MQKIEYKTDAPLEKSYLYVNGGIQSENMTFFGLAYGERTTHNIAAVGMDSGGAVYAGAGARIDTLLRKTVNASVPVTETIRSNSLLYAIRLEVSQSGNVDYSVSVDDGKTWVVAIPGEYTMLPKAAFTIQIKAEPRGGGRLNAWYAEGVSNGIHRIWVEMVEPPSNLSAVSAAGINTVSWNASPTWGATYNIYRNGVLIADGLKGTQAIDINPQKESVYSVSATVTFPKPSDYDEDVHILTRTSRSVSSSPVILNNVGIQQGADQIFGILEEEEQSLYVNSLYGGDYTFSNDTSPPPSSQRIDEKLLGSNKYCGLGFEPININTGNFYMQRQDYAFADIGAANLNLLRSYNTKSDLKDGPFGAKWESNISQHLRLYKDGTIAYVRPDGSTIYFEEQSDGSYKGNDDDVLSFEK
jgi:hypothetical protein